MADPEAEAPDCPQVPASCAVVVDQPKYFQKRTGAHLASVSACTGQQVRPGAFLIQDTLCDFQGLGDLWNSTSRFAPHHFDKLTDKYKLDFCIQESLLPLESMRAVLTFTMRSAASAGPRVDRSHCAQGSASRSSSGALLPEKMLPVAWD